jgi:O-antigen ligase
MALIEKAYSGRRTRIVALLAAVVLALWLGAFFFRRDAFAGSIRPLGLSLIAVFVALGWWRWRVALDVVLLNLPLWIMLPLRLGVPNFSLAEIALLATAVGGAFRVAQTRRFCWYATPLTPYLALMSLVVLLSSALFFVRWFEVADSVFARVLLNQWMAVFAIPDASKYHTLRGALTLIEGFVLFHVVVARMRDARDMRQLVQISLLSATLVAAFGIFQYYTHWNRVDFKPWSQRVNSTFPDVNSLASFLVANLFMLAPLLTLEGKRRPRGMAWWVLPVLFVCFYMAHSRVAFGACVVTLPLYAMLRFGRLHLERPIVWLQRKRRFLAIVFVLLFLALGFVFMRLDWQYHTDLNWTRTTGPLAKALKGRLNIWRSGFYNLAQQPWFGHGIGSYYVMLGWQWEELGTTDEWNWNPLFENAHNYFIQMLVETGIVGGGLFLLIIGLVLYQGLRAVLIHRGEERAILVGVFCGVVAFLLTWATGHPVLIMDVNLWFWFIVALLFIPHPAESAEFAQEQMSRRGFRRFLLAAVLLAAAGRWIEASKPHLPTFYGYGIHDLEFVDSARGRYPFLWLEKRAVCRLYQMHPDLEFCLRNALGERQPINVTIRVNGRRIDRVHLADARWRLCSYRLPETLHTAIKLEIRSDYEWTPPSEKRRLSVQIQSLIENSLMGD